MSLNNTKCYTKKISNVITVNQATNLYERLKNTIAWEEGIRSRNGFTRKAKHYTLGTDYEIDKSIRDGIKMITDQQFNIMGIYINYYENGEMYAPNHSHKETYQFVLSLGATRTLNIGKKAYLMKNGDGIIFGSTVHGVPKDLSVTDGRISIATFMVPMQVQCNPSDIETDEEMAKRLQMLEWNN